MPEAESYLGVNAAEALVGHRLPTGWTINEKVVRPPNATGGNFSINYWADHDDGRRGFCKVLNYYWIVQATILGADPVDTMAQAVNIYQFERDLARECVNLSRVITAEEDGSFVMPGYIQPTVSYIMFEVAEGDIRQVLDLSTALDLAGKLRALHNLATGIRQLHSRNVAHQDIKPSNTLVFAADLEGQRVTKIGDLGRASVAGRPASHDEYDIAGDPTYAPPEALYRAVPVTFEERRTACDLYQFGSMIAFVFTAAPMNALLKAELHPTVLWSNWTGTYEQALPYVQDAFGRVLQRMSKDVPESIRTRITAIVAALCNPDVEHRGWFGRKFPGRRYSLESVVSELDLLSRRAAVATSVARP